MPPRLPKDTVFVVPEKGKKKYTAIVPRDGGKTQIRVSFGHRDYQHYRDQVPVGMGGGKWSHKDHNDPQRRANYRKRHAGILSADGEPSYLKRYTPAWFSYYFLW
jgi:hypothetical protein